MEDQKTLNRIYLLENKVSALMSAIDAMTATVEFHQPLTCGQCGMQPHSEHKCLNPDCMNGYYSEAEKDNE